MSSHFRLNCKSHLTPRVALITDQSTSKGGVNIKFTVHLVIFKVSNHVLYKYLPSSGQSSSLLMKASCLRLKLVELNFFASFTTDDQSTFNVSKICMSKQKNLDPWRAHRRRPWINQCLATGLLLDWYTNSYKNRRFTFQLPGRDLSQHY